MNDEIDVDDLIIELDEQIDQAMWRVVELIRQDRTALAAAIESGDTAAIERAFAEMQATRADGTEVDAAVDEVVRLRARRVLAGACEILMQGSATGQ